MIAPNILRVLTFWEGKYCEGINILKVVVLQWRVLSSEARSPVM